MKSKQRLFEVMSRLDKTFKPNLNENSDIDESGFPRVKNMMHGLVPNVDSIGIMSAENPSGRIYSDGENKQRTQMLKEKVRGLGLGFIQPDFGMYGGKENSLMIPNINKNDLIKLSNFFQQESCIFGIKNQDQDNVYFKWEYIEEGQTKDEETVFTNLAGSDVQSSDDFYTQVKGRKFKIPFYGDDEFKKPSDDFKYKTDQRNNTFDRAFKTDEV